MDYKNKKNDMIFGFLLLICLKIYIIFKISNILIFNFSNFILLEIIFYGLVFLLLLITNFYIIKKFRSLLKLKNEESVKESRKFQNENLEHMANAPLNPIKFIIYNKNRISSDKFLIYGNSLIGIILAILFLGILYLKTDMINDFSTLLKYIIATLFFSIIVLFFSKNTAKKELEFREKLKKQESEGKKPGFLDELTWQLSVVLILASIIMIFILTNLFK